MPNHVAIVTGANHGIGAATARKLAEAGVAVVCSYLRLDDGNEAALSEEYRRARDQSAADVVGAIQRSGGAAVAVEIDLSSPESASVLFDGAEEHFGPVDILVNNASGWVQDSFTAPDRDEMGREVRPVTHDSWRRQFAVDAMAPALLIAEFARRHRARQAGWGRIIGLTSGAELGFPGEVSYGAAKAAQENYAMSAAVELAPWGITANMVHPPVTDTGWVTEEVREHVRRSRTLVHVATPGEVAAIIAYLASEEAGLITGNVIHLR